MKPHHHRWPVLVVALLFSWYGFAADGTFQGTVIKTPSQMEAVPGWIFVQGRNHLLRRVEVAHAVIFLGRQTDRRHRSCNLECLTVGQEIRITAVQDSSGEWRAKRVEILRGGSTEKPYVRVAHKIDKTASEANWTFLG